MDGNCVTNMATVPNHKPANLGELQLYRVLQCGNLLQYFDVFISQGGDDVQQLCEAGEEEFLEIMSLVGMASKPLHVRRLQKSLQEWVTTPTLFQDVIPTSPHQIPIPPGVSSGMASQQPQAQQVSPMSSSWSQSSVRDGPLAMQPSPPSPGNNSLSLPPTSTTPPQRSMSPSSVGRSSNSSPVLNMYESSILEPSTAAAIKEVAYAIVLTTRKDGEELPKSLPKKLEKQLRNVIEMSEEDPMLEEEVRKWSAIYGRFDSKRKSEKLLTLHEIMVNEAAFALCMYDRMLLCRREELFPLARQVVRESGYKFKHGKSRSASKDVECYSRAKEVSRQADVTGTSSQPPCKKIKVEPEGSNVKPDNSEHTRTVQAELSKIKRQERMTEISETLKDKRDKLEVCKERIQTAKDTSDYPCVADLQMELEQLTNEQLALMTEQADLIRQQKRSDKYYRTKARMAEQNGDEDGNDITIKQEPADEDDICVTGADSSLMSSTGSSPSREVPEVTLTHTRTPRKSALPTKRLVQETLMEEGLRLAQEHLQSEEMTSNGRDDSEQEEKDHTTAHEGPSLRKLIKQET
ncbi:NGFI-A-binding protein 1-like isoform X1 [Branchiostoma floridae x Branchiostoma japonicum]